MASQTTILSGSRRGLSLATLFYYQGNNFPVRHGGGAINALHWALACLISDILSIRLPIAFNNESQICRCWNENASRNKDVYNNSEGTS